MTFFNLKQGLLSLTVAALTFSAASAMAADVTPQASASFIVKSAADSHIRSGAKAFNQGEFDQSIKYTQRALRGSLSKKRAAIAHSNLCAVYGSLGEMDKAAASCASALELRPDYEPAQNNKAALTMRLVSK